MAVTEALLRLVTVMRLEPGCAENDAHCPASDIQVPKKADGGGNTQPGAHVTTCAGSVLGSQVELATKPVRVVLLLTTETDMVKLLVFTPAQFSTTRCGPATDGPNVQKAWQFCKYPME